MVPEIRIDRLGANDSRWMRARSPENFAIAAFRVCVSETVSRLGLEHTERGLLNNLAVHNRSLLRKWLMEKPREAFPAIGIAHLAENTQHDERAAKVVLLHFEDSAQ